MAIDQDVNGNGRRTGSRQDLLKFRLGRQSYALPVEPIKQIIPMVTITPIPQVSTVVEGIINVHGTAVPVVNLARHLGLPAVDLRLYTPILLVQAGECTIGLIVDEVTDVSSLPIDQIVHPADILPEGLGEVPVLRGVAYGGDGMVSLLDLDHLFEPDQVQALAQAAAALPGIPAEIASEEPALEGPQTPHRASAPPAEEAEERTSPALDPATACRIPLDEIGLSGRVLGCLARSGIDNIGQVIECLAQEGDEGLLKLAGIGARSLIEIHEALERLARKPAGADSGTGE
jgi:chemotaxis signal transduction protein